MIKRILTTIALVVSCVYCVYGTNHVSKVTPFDLRCEYRIDPLGIDNVTPRLSWKLIDPENTRGQGQTAYQVLVSRSLAELSKDKGDLWDSGKAQDSESVNNLYAGTTLTSNQQCFWKVRVWDVSGEPSDWSAPAKFTIGLLGTDDWKGDWIHKEDQKKTDHNWYRKTFTLSEDAASALVYVGSFGYHELYVNGEKVTDNVMNPVSSYMKSRIPYLTYDVRQYLEKGENVIAIWHAAGWARWKRIREYRVAPFVFKAQAEIKTKSEALVLATDESWKCKKSHSEYRGDWDILRFGGELIDARRLEPNWNKADYDDSDWANASIFDVEAENAKSTEDEITIAINSSRNITVKKGKFSLSASLSSQMVEPQVRFKEIIPVGVTENSDGTYLIDMGENYTGFFEMNLHQGTEGESVIFEIADKDIETMSWSQKSEYIFDKTGEGVFENRFNIAGGRWITVYGLNYKPELSDIKGYVITNDRKRISKFESSSELLNQIYEMNLDTYIANTLDGILMDCPHRERRGWGEVTVAAMHGDALPNFESGAYMDQYFQFMRDSQFADGNMRAVINEEDRPFLMWKANNPITVWETYRMLGDEKVLRDNYESMQKWFEWLYRNSNYDAGGALIVGERGKREFPGLGDWCTPEGNFWDSSNSPNAIHFNNCLYAFMLDCAVNIATALGEKDDAKTYADRLQVQRTATHHLSYDPATGKYGSGKQIDQAFALIAGITPESEIDAVYSNLVDNMLYEFPYYNTGSSGQALYTRYFTEVGERMDLIYEFLRDTRHPSYGYFIEQGATVWPERWSAVGSSRIHTCYTGIGGYFIKGFGGIRPDPEVSGMRQFIVKPVPVGDLEYANTEYESMYGTITSNWKVPGEMAFFHVEVPVNCTAKIYIPAAGKPFVRENGILAHEAEGVTYVGSEASDAVGHYEIYEVGAGIYDFKVEQGAHVSYPDPLYSGNNLSTIGRINASSMFIESEKNPGFEAFKINDGDPETAWQAAEVKDQWVEVEWFKPQSFDKIVLQEVGDHMTRFKVQYWNGGKWFDIVTDTTCGSRKEYTFGKVKTKKCRLYISNASAPVSIAEFEIHRSR